jgi:hypothetical protein
LILVLGDHIGYCGDGDRKTAAWYTDGYRGKYLAWVRTVATRLRDSPAIAMWEVVKGTTDIDASTLRAFYDVVGGELHRIAPRHLVESGSHGPWAYGGEDGYRLIHDSPGLDVAAFADYNMAPGAAESLPQALRALAPLDKPLIAGELAFAASRSGDPTRKLQGKPCLSWAARAEGVRAKLNASFALDLAGVNLWSWMPKSPGNCRLEIYPDDPLMEMVREYKLP